MDFKRYNSNIYIFVISIVVIAMLIILHIFGILRPIESYFKASFEPVQSYFYNSTKRITNYFSLLTSIKDLENDNIELARRVEELQVEKVEIMELQNENQTLREQLGFAEDKKDELIPSFVISRDPSNFFVSFGIDKGTNDGVEKGMPVVVSDGILVGQIFEAHKYSSQVMLLVDTRSKINAKIIDSDATGIVMGEHNLAIAMDLIPQNKVIKKGDLITTSGLGEQFPSGLLIGEVEDVSDAENELFQRTRVRPAADYQNLSVVFVVKTALRLTQE